MVMDMGKKGCEEKKEEKYYPMMYPPPMYPPMMYPPPPYPMMGHGKKKKK